MIQTVVAGKPAIPVWVPIIILFAGVVLSCANQLALGLSLIVVGSVAFAFTKKRLITSETKSPVVKKSIYIDPNDKLKMNNILTKGQFAKLSTIKSKDIGSRIEFVFSKDHLYASAQIFDYIPHRYVEGSPLFEYFDEEAQQISSVIEKFHN